MNEEKFTKIVDETKSIVLSAIKKHLFNDYFYAIDDVVQETYIRAYKSLVKNKFKEEAKLSSWLYVIAKNESIRMNKKLKREEERRERYAEKRIKYYANEFFYNPDDEVSRNENIRKLKNAIFELPDKYKEVFSLYIKGYNEKQISELLSISRGTVKSRTHRGKEILSNMLNKEVKYE